MKDYFAMLYIRARQAAPRQLEERTATFLQERNNACLAAWKQRYHQRLALPRPWPFVPYALHQNYLDRERKRARDWLDARKLQEVQERIRRSRNVITLKPGTKIREGRK
jgi:hypothetical protein